MLLSDREKGGRLRRPVARVLTESVFHPPFTPEQTARAQCGDDEKLRRSGAFAKPSHGLEPSTSSLPWKFRRGKCVDSRSSGDAASAANPPDSGLEDASRDVVRVVPDVSVLCPRLVADLGNVPTCRARGPRIPAWSPSPGAATTQGRRPRSRGAEPRSRRARVPPQCVSCSCPEREESCA
jgi:hypothetical protein